MGAFERGVELSRRAQRLNPLHPGWYYFSFARLHYSQKRYEDALTELQRVGLPHFYWTQMFTAALLGQLGRPEAAAALARMSEIKPGFSARDDLRKWNTAPDDLEHLMQGLRMAGLRE